MELLAVAAIAIAVLVAKDIISRRLAKKRAERAHQKILDRRKEGREKQRPSRFHY